MCDELAASSKCSLVHPCKMDRLRQAREAYHDAAAALEHFFGELVVGVHPQFLEVVPRAERVARAAGRTYGFVTGTTFTAISSSFFARITWPFNPASLMVPPYATVINWL